MVPPMDCNLRSALIVAVAGIFTADRDAGETLVRDFAGWRQSGRHAKKRNSRIDNSIDQWMAAHHMSQNGKMGQQAPSHGADKNHNKRDDAVSDPLLVTMDA